MTSFMLRVNGGCYFAMSMGQMTVMATPYNPEKRGADA